jgi:predicted nucleic acid-binding protein
LAVNGVLLDTSGYIHLLKGHPAVAEAVGKADRIVLNPVVVGELLWGFRKSRFRKRNEEHLSKFLARPSVDLIEIDGQTAERYAAIKDSLHGAGTPVPTGDLWIAASAMQHGLRVLTADSDFLRIPQILVERVETPGDRPLLRPKPSVGGRRRGS